MISKPVKYVFTDIHHNHKYEPICEGYIGAIKSAFTFRTLAIVLLTLTGHKVRLIIEETVEKVGYGDITSKGIYVMKVVFYCYMFNFAVLLLMNNANLKS